MKVSKRYAPARSLTQALTICCATSFPLAFGCSEGDTTTDTEGEEGKGGQGGSTEAEGGAEPEMETEPMGDPAFAADLDELFMDRPCVDGSTSIPPAEGATCDLSGEQHEETIVTFGGDPEVTYEVTLRVRAIWEPTKIIDGDRPYSGTPFTVGGEVEPGTSDSAAINYQQFFISVESPEQTYFLNNYLYVGHDIYKADYEASILVQGGSEVRVVVNDGNERQIANFSEELFDDLPPYDETPTLGQFLRLDVVSVEVAP